MAQKEWKSAEMRKLAADLRQFTEAVRGCDCSCIKRLANELGLEAADMEASKAGGTPGITVPRPLGIRAICPSDSFSRWSGSDACFK